MLLSLNCCVVVLLGLFAATACAAPDSANQQAERLHVKRLMNGFVAITAEQNVIFLFFFCKTSIYQRNCYAVFFCVYLRCILILFLAQVELSYTGERPTFFDQFPRPLAQVDFRRMR